MNVYRFTSGLRDPVGQAYVGFLQRARQLGATRRMDGFKAKVELTILSDVEIEKRIKEKSLVLTPYDPDSLNGAGYDLRLGMDVAIPSSSHRLVATLERLELPEDLAGTLHIRSSLARAGVVGSLALVDPGFRGQLTISLFNAGPEPVRMKKGDRFVQMTLHLLGMKTRRPYRGRYQDSQGIVETRRE